MPVRIYEIAKELSLESKLVLAKAKELGIAGAKVPSSSLDKITAEYLREQLLPLAPGAAAAPAEVSGPAPVAPVVDDRPVIIVLPPAPAPEPETTEPAPAEYVEEPALGVSDSLPSAESRPELVLVRPPASEAPVLVAPTPAVRPTRESKPAVAEVSAEPKTQPAPSPTPTRVAPPQPTTEPPKSQIGQLVGRINLGNRYEGRAGGSPPPQRPAAAQPQQRSGMGRPNDRRGPGGPMQGGPRPQSPNRPDQGQNVGHRPGVNRPGQGMGQGTGGPRPPARPAAPARPVLAADAPSIIMKPPIIVRELAEKMGKKPFQVIADLMAIGAFVTVNQTIDAELAQRVCAKNNIRFDTEKRNLEAHHVNVQPREQKLELDQDDKIEELQPRAPVITIMGHVDHGKTSLLDVIRKANVVAGEAGGITQHIGAYTISYPHPKTGALQQLTFLDTPGHAAFSAMRARGANVTDVVILVVAATDGVMPQTLEALSHARVAKVPIIVAVNKCDHPNANPLKVRQQLQEKGLVPDDWGGDTLYVDCSAHTKQGIDKLIDSILLQVELLELKANPNRKAKGNVIESGVEAGGPVATVLVRKGTLCVGAVIICGEHYGRVRAMMNEEGQRLKEAIPSVAVRVLGLNGVPEAGSEFSAVDNEKAARVLAGERFEARKKAELEGVRPRRTSLEDIFGGIKDASTKVLKVIVKADTQGSVEAIAEALRKIDSSKVSMEIIRDAVGAITVDDIMLAASANAVVLGFHTRVDSSAAEAAKREGIQIKLYAIIYELIDQVKDAMAGLLDPLLKEVVIGQAEVRKVFELSKGGKVAGCYVSSGKLLRGKMRVRRKTHLIYEGVSLTLKRFQDEVNEVRAGMECGVRLDGFDDYLESDIIECYAVEKVAQQL
jgi:translation initiation factor IF-2